MFVFWIYFFGGISYNKVLELYQWLFGIFYKEFPPVQDFISSHLGYQNGLSTSFLQIAVDVPPSFACLSSCSESFIFFLTCQINYECLMLALKVVHSKIQHVWFPTLTFVRFNLWFLIKLHTWECSGLTCDSSLTRLLVWST